ncbi:A-kinase anchor protein 17A-like [Clytia hemisphaerica]
MAAAVIVSAADLSECVELHAMRNLFLKPISKLVIVVTMPAFKTPGVTVSNWEVMERLKSMVAPDQFTQLKVAKSSVELLTFDAEVDSKTTLSKFLIKLDGKTIKLSNFGEPLRVRAARKKIPFPKRHDWNTYFKEAQTTNENNPGERPDTVYIGHLPTKWFVETDRDNKPSELVVAAVFSKFGEVRAVDIPNNDPYRERITMLAEAKENKDNPEKSVPVLEAASAAASGFKVFSHNSNIHFDCYIQYMDYTGFAKCMKQLRAKKLLFMIEDEKGATASVDVDFDKTQHMSEKNIKRRNRRRERLIRTDVEQEETRRREQEERERKDEIERLEARRQQLLELKEVQELLQAKEQRRAFREEKRKQKREEKRTIERQQKEREKKTIELTEAMKVQRKEEAVAIVTELLTRIAKRKEEDEIAEARRQAEMLLRKQIEEKKRKLDEEKKKEEELKKKQEMSLDDEEKELKKRLKKIMMAKKQKQKDKKKQPKGGGGGANDEPPSKKTKRSSKKTSSSGNPQGGSSSKTSSSSSRRKRDR